MIYITNYKRTAMTGNGNVDHVEIVFLYNAVKVYINKILPRRAAQCLNNMFLMFRF